MNLESTAVDNSKDCLLSISITQNVKLVGSKHHPQYSNAFMNACFCGKNWALLNIAATVYCILSLHKAGQRCMKYDKCIYAAVYAEVENKINIEM